MPAGTRVARCVQHVKAKGGKGKANPYAVCQASTQQSYSTGKSLKKKKRKFKAKHDGDTFDMEEK